MQENGNNSVWLKVATLTTLQTVAETSELRQPADRINESALRSTISEDEKACEGQFRAQIYLNDAKIFNLLQPQGGAALGADPALGE